MLPVSTMVPNANSNNNNNNNRTEQILAQNTAGTLGPQLSSLATLSYGNANKGNCTDLSSPSLARRVIFPMLYKKSCDDASTTTCSNSSAETANSLFGKDCMSADAANTNRARSTPGTGSSCSTSKSCETPLLPLMTEAEEQRLRSRLDHILPLSDSPRNVSHFPHQQTQPMPLSSPFDSAKLSLSWENHVSKAPTIPRASAEHNNRYRKVVLNNNPMTTPMVRRSTTLFTNASQITLESAPTLPQLQSRRRTQSLTLPPSARSSPPQAEHRTLPPLPSILKTSACFGQDRSGGDNPTLKPRIAPMPPTFSVSSDMPSLTSASSTESLLTDDTADTSETSSSSPVPLLKASVMNASSTGNNPRQRSASARCLENTLLLAPQKPLRRCVSEGVKAIKFDPHVWVRVFTRPPSEADCVWYTPRDLDRFKKEAMQHIIQYHQATMTTTTPIMLPTGTGRMVVSARTNCPRATQVGIIQPKMLFSHRALSSWEDDDDDDDMLCAPASSTPSPSTSLMNKTVRTEISKILVVDPLEICRKLLRHTLELLLPHASITTASSSAEAQEIFESDPSTFDLVLVEEHLSKHESGSKLLETWQKTHPHVLFIGLTAHYVLEKELLLQSGADMVWGKPPPLMNEALRNDILKKLLTKRGKTQLLQGLFATGGT